MECGIGLCGHCQTGRALRVPGRSRLLADPARRHLRQGGHLMPAVAARPRLRVGIVKMASCDGCQLTLLDLEDELLALADRFEIVEFPEASSLRSAGPYDVLLVEGIASARRTRPPRSWSSAARRSCLVTIGACASYGGIQALRNWSDHDVFRAAVYAASRVRRFARDGHPGLGARQGGRRAPRLPDQPGAAPRGARVGGRRPPAADPRGGGLPRVQARAAPCA